MNYTMRETHLQANSSEWVFIRKPCTVSELPTELEALKESPELTIELKLFLSKHYEQLDQWNSTVFLINTTALWKNSVLQKQAVR